jgi:hypothetical protein
MTNREDNYYKEEVRKGWKEAWWNGLWGVEIDLLRMIEGNGWRWWDMRIHRFILFYSVLSRSIETRPEDGLPASHT